MTRTHGFRVKTRSLFTKHARSGFTRTILDLKETKEGDKVVILIDPAVHKGMPHRRYHGKVGTVLGQRGRGLEVATDKQGKTVKLVVGLEHLKKTR